jgi:hypothetical protein
MVLESRLGFDCGGLVFAIVVFLTVFFERKGDVYRL